MGYGPAQHGPAWPRWSAALDLLQHFDPDAMALGAVLATCARAKRWQHALELLLG